MPIGCSSIIWATIQSGLFWMHWWYVYRYW